MKTEILYGLHPVREALLAGKRTMAVLYISSSRKEGVKQELMDLAANQGVSVEQPGPAFFKNMEKGNQGIAARVSPLRPLSLEAMLDQIQPGANPFLLLLDGIHDPRNLGALVRSALCAGVDGVISPADRASPWSPTASKASAGALEHMRLVRVVNLVRSIQMMKKRGFWITGLDASGPEALWDVDFTGPTAIVVGGEGKGVRPLVKKECDHVAHLPQAGPLGSLNASVAGALAMFEVVRQRRNAQRRDG